MTLTSVGITGHPWFHKMFYTLRRQSIIWSNGIILSVETIEVKFSSTWTELQSLLIHMDLIMPSEIGAPFLTQLVLLRYVCIISVIEQILTQFDWYMCRPTKWVNASSMWRLLNNAYNFTHYAFVCHCGQRYIDICGFGILDNNIVGCIAAYVVVICIYRLYVLWS